MRGLEPLDFAQNLNPFGPPPSVARLDISHPEGYMRYGDAYAVPIRSSASDAFRIEGAHIGVGLGATQILFALPRMLGKRRALIPSPSFWEYGVANERAGIPAELLELRAEDDFVIDIDRLASSLKEPAAVYLSNICNPTSRLTDKAALISLIQSNPDSAFVVDETYLLFREDFEAQSLARHVAELPNLFVVQSLSKVFSLPGMRIGLLFAHADAVARYESEFSFPYGVSLVGEQLACAALADTDFLTATRRFMATERVRLTALYKEKLGSQLKVIEPEGNFLLAHLTRSEAVEKLHVRMKGEFGITVRKGSDIPGLDDSWIRFCIRAEKENDRLASALATLLSPERS